MASMINKRFNPDYPIVIALHGRACAGKTATASRFVPGPSISMGFLQWDLLSFAAPLKEMVSTIQQIEGEMRKDRIKYAVHDILTDLFSHSPLYGAPSYNDLVTLVNEACDLPVEGTKPRGFMQYVATRCREIDPDCFVKTMKRKIAAGPALIKRDDATYADLSVSTNVIQQQGHYCAIIDDLRFENEAEMINKMPNGIVIELTASDETRSDRAYKRDGVQMTPEQASHVSENTVIPAELIAATIDTDNLDADEVATQVSKYMYETLGGLWDYAKTQ